MIVRATTPHAYVRPNSSISAMRPPCYYSLEEIVILGVIYGTLVWKVCNPAAPAGVRGIPGLSPVRPWELERAFKQTNRRRTYTFELERAFKQTNRRRAYTTQHRTATHRTAQCIQMR